MEVEIFRDIKNKNFVLFGKQLEIIICFNSGNKNSKLKCVLNIYE